MRINVNVLGVLHGLLLVPHVFMLTDERLFSRQWLPKVELLRIKLNIDETGHFCLFVIVSTENKWVCKNFSKYLHIGACVNCK